MAHAVVQEKEAFFQIIRIEIGLKLSRVLAGPDPSLKIFHRFDLAEHIRVQTLHFHRVLGVLPFHETVHLATKDQATIPIPDLEWWALDSYRNS